MPVSLVRESKSAATIRRRRKGQRSKIHIRHKTHNLDESWDSGEEDPELPLEPFQVTLLIYGQYYAYVYSLRPAYYLNEFHNQN